jgi:transposase
VPYSKEFRREVLAACDAGEGTRAVALRFNVSESWVRRVKQERREQGKLGPATKRRRVPAWAKEADALCAIVARRCDLTLGELRAELGTSLSESTLCRALRKLRLTLKKKSSGRPSSNGPTWSSDARSGAFARPGSIPIVSSFSMKPG